MNLTPIGSVAGLPPAELDMLNDLVNVWASKLTRNKLRSKYYDSKNRLKDLGIAIPPPLKNVETVVGWPAKAVDALAQRSRFDGFSFDGENDFGMGEIVKRNKLKRVYAMATHDELINSCSFLTTSKGKDDEPAAIISAYTALQGSALWDMRKKRIKCGLVVVDVDNDVKGEPTPTWLNLYTDTATWEIKKDDFEWRARKNQHSMGRPMMEPMAYRASLERPFGRSRISRAVMSITDSAVRCALRSEVGAEFFTAPQKYILGAEDTLFEDQTKWEAYIGNFLALTKDEDGEFPRVGMFAGSSMQPHIDYMRSLAARFAGETGVPISELGVIHDNPASAEAIYAAKETLVIEAENLNQDNGDALTTIGLMALAVAQNKPLSELTDEEMSLRPKWKNPARPSLVSQADAIVKAISAIPTIAESPVALEELGFDEEQVRRLQADKQKAIAQAMLQSSMQAGETAHQTTMYEMASIIKSYRAGSINRKNAIILFKQIGIEEDEANSILADSEDVLETTGESDEDGSSGRDRQPSERAGQAVGRVKASNS